MLPTYSSADPDWLPNVLEALRHLGGAVVTDVLSPQLLGRIRAGMYRAQGRLFEEIGAARLARAGEAGVMRVMLRHDPVFAELLELPQLLAVVDATVSDTAILHLQNGFILPPYAGDAGRLPELASTWTSRVTWTGYIASVNAMLAVDPSPPPTARTLVVPGTHQRTPVRPQSYMKAPRSRSSAPPGR